MKCTFLGTGYSINTLRRHNTSLFLQKGDTGVLIDCNGGCTRQLAAIGFPIENLEHVFLTHEHLDHIGFLNNLIHQVWLKSSYYRPENRRTTPLNIHANERTIKMVQAVINAYGLLQSPHIFPIVFHTIPADGATLKFDEIELTCFPVSHSQTPCFGVVSRSGDQRGLVYSADTEPVPQLYSYLQDGDVMIHECNSVDEALNTGHTTLQQLKEIAPSYPTVDFYLVHLPEMTEEKEAFMAKALSAEYNDKIRFAQDGATLSL